MHQLLHVLQTYACRMIYFFNVCILMIFVYRQTVLRGQIAFISDVMEFFDKGLVIDKIACLR